MNNKVIRTYALDKAELLWLFANYNSLGLFETKSVIRLFEHWISTAGSCFRIITYKTKIDIKNSILQYLVNINY